MRGECIAWGVLPYASEGGRLDRSEVCDATRRLAGMPYGVGRYRRADRVCGGGVFEPGWVVYVAGRVWSAARAGDLVLAATGTAVGWRVRISCFVVRPGLFAH